MTSTFWVLKSPLKFSSMKAKPWSDCLVCPFLQRRTYTKQKEFTMTSPVKVGWKTTEFWMTIFTMVVMTLFALGVIDESTRDAFLALTASAAAAIVYGLGRAYTKAANSTPPTSAATIMSVTNSPPDISGGYEKLE